MVLASNAKTVPTSAQMRTTWPHSGQAAKHNSPWPWQQGQRGCRRYHVGGTIRIRFGFLRAREVRLFVASSRQWQLGPYPPAVGGI
jgi:hypothetical protein